MDKSDIEYLLKNNMWITVYPLSEGIWKSSIYKKSNSNKWKIKFSTKKKTPKECYNWIEDIFKELKELK